MIKANELMVGNWVFDKINQKNVRVTIIDAALPLNIRIGYKIENGFWCHNQSTYNPIPLTPEILEKAGFVRDYNIFVYQPEFENIQYRLTEFPAGTWIASKGFINYNHELTLIRYLHQLQNLFFALMGEELPISDLEDKRSVATEAK